MGRSIQKAVDEYIKRGHDTLCVDDIDQILRIAQREGSHSVLFEAISTAFMAGHSVGYRTAKRKARTKAAT